MDQLNPPPPTDEPKKKGGRPRSDLPRCPICHRLKHKCPHGREGSRKEDDVLPTITTSAEDKVEEGR